MPTHVPLTGGLEGTNQTFTNEVESSLTTQLEISQRPQGAVQQLTRAPKDPTPSGVPMNPRATKSTWDNWGNRISFGGKVEKGLLHQDLRDQVIWIVEVGDLGG